MRLFENFPEQAMCPLCGTNKNAPCLLVPIDGTFNEEEHICQAIPVHADCMTSDGWHYHKDVNVIYKQCVLKPEGEKEHGENK
jgi:hypothetical protein